MDPRNKNRFFAPKLTKYLCYLDETGNTGLNHFDENQSHFMLGCAISKKDIDQSSKNEFNKIHEQIDTSELHANHLGPDKIGELTEYLLRIIKKNDLRFVFIDIEKQHYLSMMMFHQIYDPGLNKAATNAAFVFKIQRLTLAYNFSLLVDMNDKKEFWNSVRDGKVDDYVKVLKRIKNKLELSLLDFRSKELIGDALAYTIKFPSEIFESMLFNELVSPNNSALGLLLNALHAAFPDRGARVEKFLHDEQRQFGKYLKKQYDITSHLYTPNSKALDSMFDVKPVNLFKGTDIEFSSSDKSLGLQLVDTVLWVFKRYHYGRSDEATLNLYNEILKRSGVVGITYDMHIQELMDLQEDLYSRDIDLTPENIKRAQSLLSEIENNRWKEK